MSPQNNNGRSIPNNNLSSPSLLLLKAKRSDVGGSSSSNNEFEDIMTTTTDDTTPIIFIESSSGGDGHGEDGGGDIIMINNHPHHSTNTKTGICRTSLTIIAWYTVSNTAILATKWLFTNHFSYPLTVTTYSNFTSFVWAAILTLVFPSLRPTRSPSKHEFIHYILPIGFFTALEIGCSNLALKLLTVSFGTILKGSAPIFTFGFGLLVGVEIFIWSIFTSLMLIATGIALASFGEGHEFQLLGFCLQLIGTALGGLRWAMTHKILQDGDDITTDEPMTPLTATLYTAPMTAICVLPFAIVLEGTEVITSGDFSLFVWFIMTGIATLVFLLLMSEYWLVKVTSSLALSVAGVFKELLTIGGGIFFFAEKIDYLNVVGFLMCQIGIVFYVCLRYDNNDNDKPTNSDGGSREGEGGNYSSILSNTNNNNNKTSSTTTETEIELSSSRTKHYTDNNNNNHNNNNSFTISDDEDEDDDDNNSRNNENIGSDDDDDAATTGILT